MSIEGGQPGLSFIIPVLNEAAGIEALLKDLRTNFPRSELLIVDGGSSDDTVRRGMALADVVLLGERGRARQMNLGAAAARGDYLLFLHADTLPRFSESQLCAALASSPAWAFCSVALASQKRSLAMVSWFMNRRSRWTSVATGDQLFIVRRDVFEAAGGFADMPLMEDIELSKRLRQRAPPTALSLSVETSARRWEKQGVPRAILLMWWLRLAYWCGVSPPRLWRWYYGSDFS